MQHPASTDYAPMHDSDGERDDGQPSKDSSEIRWPLVEVASSTFEVVNAEALRHPHFYQVLHVLTVAFQLFGASILLYGVLNSKSDMMNDYDDWCHSHSDQYHPTNQDWVLAFNKFIALMLATMCCLKEVTLLSDLLAEGLFIHSTLRARLGLWAQTAVHLASVIIIFAATCFLTYYESAFTDIYLNW